MDTKQGETSHNATGKGNGDSFSTFMSQANGWGDPHSERQLNLWVKAAQLNSAINELAALHYTKLYTIALVFVSILTIIVGSKGIATLAVGNVTGINIATSVCEISLGIFASLLSNMELKTKSVNFSRRAIGYGKLASFLRVQMVLLPHERANKIDLLQSIPEKVEYLDDLAEPLPLKYREMAEHSHGGIMNMFSNAAQNRLQETPNAPYFRNDGEEKPGSSSNQHRNALPIRHHTAQAPRIPATGLHHSAQNDEEICETMPTSSAIYDERADFEGTSCAIIKTIMNQKL
jgi:hypothetical protein